MSDQDLAFLSLTSSHNCLAPNSLNCKRREPRRHERERGVRQHSPCPASYHSGSAQIVVTGGVDIRFRYCCFRCLWPQHRNRVVSTNLVSLATLSLLTTEHLRYKTQTLFRHVHWLIINLEKKLPEEELSDFKLGQHYINNHQNIL